MRWINGRWIEPGLYDEIALLSDGVPDRLAEALQRLENFRAALGVPGIDGVDVGAGRAILVRRETEIDAQFPRRVRNELGVELNGILQLRRREVDVSPKNRGVERMEAIFK